MLSFNQVQGDLQFLKEDIATVERRRQELLRAKDRFSKRTRFSSDLSSPNLDTYSGSDKAGDGGAISVWRGGQGGAFVPPSENQFRAGNTTRNLAFPLGKKDGVMAGHFLENPFLDPQSESKGVQTVSKKRRVLAQVCTFVS